jgi:hypothetical protein
MSIEEFWKLLDKDDILQIREALDAGFDVNKKSDGGEEVASSGKRRMPFVAFRKRGTRRKRVVERER